MTKDREHFEERASQSNDFCENHRQNHMSEYADIGPVVIAERIKFLEEELARLSSLKNLVIEELKSQIESLSQSKK